MTTKNINDINHHYEAFDIILTLAEERFGEKILRNSLKEEERERIEKAFEVIEELAEAERIDFEANHVI